MTVSGLAGRLGWILDHLDNHPVHRCHRPVLGRLPQVKELLFQLFGDEIGYFWLELCPRNQEKFPATGTTPKR